MLHVLGVGHYHPSAIIDNAFLESLDIGTDENWIVERVGIHRRHTALPLSYIRDTRNRDPRDARHAATENAAQMAAAAARVALTRAGVDASDVGLVVAGGSSPDYGAPAYANLIAAELNIDVPTFDLNAACSTFAYQMHWLRCAASGMPRFTLLVQPENLTKSVDYSDRRTAVLMGDSAAAFVVSGVEHGAARCEYTSIGSQPLLWQKVQIPARGFLQQDGTAVQTFAIRRTVEIARPLVRDGSYFVGHQANLLMLTSAAQRCGVPCQRHHHNVSIRGNCGAAGAPSVVSENWDRYCAEGARVVIGVVGAGLSWGSMTLQFDCAEPSHG